jgi:uncharacterized repeat protein (TIGR03803 family)
MDPVRWPTALAVGIAVVAGATSLSAQPTYTVIADLGSIAGRTPLGGVIRGADGALYGTTFEGGAENCGLVYRIDPAGTLSSVHEFGQSSGGCGPVGELALGPDGSLYGVAYKTSTIYKIAADGTFTVLYQFPPPLPPDPSQPEPFLVPFGPFSGPTLAPDGFFYGTTVSSDVYRISPEGAFSLVHQFQPDLQPNGLVASLTVGADGYLYGTSPTFYIIVPRDGGTLFRVNPAGGAEVLRYFFVLRDPTNGTIFSPEGAFPRGELAAGPDGEFYGATERYGPNNGDQGTILRRQPDGTIVVLHAFAADPHQVFIDGAAPQAGLILGSDGYVYGTTPAGGANGNGTIFRIGRGGGLATLRSFAEDGLKPTKGRLFEGAPGVFYGTAPSTSGGVVYELRVADALLAESRLVTTNEDQAVEGILTATGSGPTATFALVSNGSRGVATIDPVTGAFTYTPDADVNGSDTFTFVVTDGARQSNPAMVTVQIVEVNDPPVALDSSLTTPENTPVQGTLSAQDPDSPSLSFAIVTMPTKGTVDLTPFTNQFTYTPAPGATGADSFTFQASDFALPSNVATVTITVGSTPLTLSLTAPLGGETLFVGIPTAIQWMATGADRIDVHVSRDGGRSFEAIPQCSGLPGASTSCTWTPDGRPTPQARFLVVGATASGEQATASTGDLRISGAPPRLNFVGPSPNTVSIGSVQALRWNHNLGGHSFVRLELSRDGGATWEVIAPAVQNTSDHHGAVDWQVSGPATASALLRITSLSTNVSDVSKRPFSIATNTF